MDQVDLTLVLHTSRLALHESQKPKNFFKELSIPGDNKIDLDYDPNEHFGLGHP